MKRVLEAEPPPQRLTLTGIINGSRRRSKQPEDEACLTLIKGDVRLVWYIKLVDHEKIITTRQGDLTLGGHFAPSHLPFAQRAFDSIVKLSLIQPLTTAYMEHVTRRLGNIAPAEQTNDNTEERVGWH